MRRPTRIALLTLFAAGAALTAASNDVARLRPVTTPVYVGGDGVGLLGPESVACSDEAVAVADTGNGRVLKYAFADGTLTPTANVVIPGVTAPTGVQIGPDGSLFVLDGRTHRIARVGADGANAGFVDLGDDRASIVRDFRIDRDGNVVVLDVGTAFVRVFEVDGGELSKTPFPEDAGFLSGLAIGRTGDIYALDSVGRKIFVARRGAGAFEAWSEDLAGFLDFPSALDVDGRGNVYVADTHGGGIVIVGVDGGFRGRSSAWGWAPGRLRYPTGVCVQADGVVFVADRGNNRVQVYTIVE